MKVCTLRACWYKGRCDDHYLAWNDVTSDKPWILKNSYNAVCNPNGHDKWKGRKLRWVTGNSAPVLPWVQRSNLITKRHPLVPSRGFITESWSELIHWMSSGLCVNFVKLCNLTFILLMWRIWWVPINAINCQVGFNPSNAQLNPICPLLALFGTHHILNVSR